MKKTRIAHCPLWLLDANTEGEDVEIVNGEVVWHDGTWKSGTWENGTWEGGVWEEGTWKDGVWRNGVWKNGIWEKGTWVWGVWKNGLWGSGYWEDGLWKGGTWVWGVWEKGTWEKGEWRSGKWKDGIWKGGTLVEKMRNEIVELVIMTRGDYFVFFKEKRGIFKFTLYGSYNNINMEQMYFFIPRTFEEIISEHTSIGYKVVKRITGNLALEMQKLFLRIEL